MKETPSPMPPIELTLDAKGPPLAQIEQNQITISEQIQFKTDSAEILPDSEPIVDGGRGDPGEHEDE